MKKKTNGTVKEVRIFDEVADGSKYQTLKTKKDVSTSKDMNKNRNEIRINLKSEATSK